ncbi:MAG: type I DNA topoisomerase [Spirochaetota bacterium]|nr:type I DNA topoisomerase [Spirochaetota bacterium]
MKQTPNSERKTLVIVESPTKANTIRSSLGAGYLVEASMGHVIDLPKSRMGVHIEDGFEPDYITVRGRGKILNNLKKLAGKASSVLLAADEDREGEAISFHLMRELRRKYPDIRIERIVFHEITPSVIREAAQHPVGINLPKVQAQKARRVLDRLVGYTISPILWEKVKKGLSAGRVQSVALRMICERERQIGNFVPSEYWRVKLGLAKGKNEIEVELARVRGEKAEIGSREAVNQVLAEVRQGSFVCANIKMGKSVRKTTPPFTTSKMQQDAANKIGFTSDRTMRVAQQLYEGIELASGPVGLITYMRTDSTRISDQAIEQVRRFIAERYGAGSLPESPVMYANKKGSQNAHEAIRPTDVFRAPDSIKDFLSRDQYRLYKLIWSKFVASQMRPAELETTTVEITNGDYLFTASGSRVVQQGYQKVYNEDEEKEDKAPKLSKFAVGDVFELVNDALSTQHFTQPPPRYTDASIIKVLDETGIGRPSTFASIVTTLLKRYYIVRQNKQLIPSELGKLIDDLLVRHFQKIVDVDFTADMEEQLDQVEEERLEWQELLANFYRDFKPTLEAAQQDIENMKTIFDQPTEYTCEKCGKGMVKRLGRYGYFLACSGFPDCKTTRPIPLAPCPRKDCGGDIVAKKGRRGRLFYGCSHYKDDGTGCDFVSWDKPVLKPCPKCGGLLVERRLKEEGFVLACSDEGCGYTEKAEA